MALGSTFQRFVDEKRLIVGPDDNTMAVVDVSMVGVSMKNKYLRPTFHCFCDVDTPLNAIRPEDKDHHGGELHRILRCTFADGRQVALDFTHQQYALPAWKGKPLAMMPYDEYVKRYTATVNCVVNAKKWADKHVAGHKIDKQQIAELQSMQEEGVRVFMDCDEKSLGDGMRTGDVAIHAIDRFSQVADRLLSLTKKEGKRLAWEAIEADCRTHRWW